MMKFYENYDVARNESVSVIVHKYHNGEKNELVSCAGFDSDQIAQFYELVFDTIKRCSGAAYRENPVVKVVTGPGGETVYIINRERGIETTHTIMYLVGNQA